MLQREQLSDMYPNNIENEIIEKSLEEVSKIFQWAYDGKVDLTNTTTILVGGWAVDVYNPWYGSVDIDLLTTSNHKKDLQNYLYKEREFKKQRDENGYNHLFKKIGDEEIIIDFVRKKQQFYKTEDKISYNFSDKDLSIEKIRNQGEAIVPTRSNLLMMKIKAAWDRYHRVQDRNVENISYLKAKYTKDCGDIVALLDTTSRPDRTLDLNLISKELTSRPYLMKFLEELNIEAYGRLEYRNMNRREMIEIIENLLSLVGTY